MWVKKQRNEVGEKILLENGVEPFIARVASQIVSFNNIEEYNKAIDSEYKNLTDPYSIGGIEDAVKLFASHVKSKSKIASIGDFDCDGVISSTMLYELCKCLSTTCKTFLPCRFKHGYGLNSKTIASFKEKVGTPPDLLFVLDCGTNSFNEVAELKSWGVKNIIIIDHHLPSLDESSISRNADIMINWHFDKNVRETCTCGLMYHFIRGIRKCTSRVNPIEFLTYSAIGILADSSPVIGDNRLIVKNGLKDFAISNVVSCGLKALMTSSYVKGTFLTVNDVSFKIAPKINAVGRMGDPLLAFKLLTEGDTFSAEKLAVKVDEINNERKKVQNAIEDEAIQLVRSVKPKYGAFLKSKEWHIGVNGIVASKVSEEIKLPTIICSFHEGKWKGSGRSINGISIKKILDDCSYCFERMGGHDMAIGCVLKSEYEDTFAEIFDKACEKYYKKDESDVNYYDAVLNPLAVTEENASLLIQKIYPYCRINFQEPIFKLKDVFVYNSNIKTGNGWKLTLFNVANKDVNIKYQFKTFVSKFDSEIEGMKVNVYFKFPHSWDNSDFSFNKFTLEVVDIEKA